MQSSGGRKQQMAEESLSAEQLKMKRDILAYLAMRQYVLKVRLMMHHLSHGDLSAGQMPVPEFPLPLISLPGSVYFDWPPKASEQPPPPPPQPAQEEVRPKSLASALERQCLREMSILQNEAAVMTTTSSSTASAEMPVFLYQPTSSTFGFPQQNVLDPEIYNTGEEKPSAYANVPTVLSSSASSTSSTQLFHHRQSMSQASEEKVLHVLPSPKTDSSIPCPTPTCASATSTPMKISPKPRQQPKKDSSSGPKKLFLCQHPSCTYVSNRKNNLSRHVDTMHNPGRFSARSCCGHLFESKGAFRTHVRVAHQDGFRCSRCGNMFKRDSLLRRHMFTHTGERFVSCDFAGCYYSSSHMSNLKRHRETHLKNGDKAMGRSRKRKEQQQPTDFIKRLMVEQAASLALPQPLASPPQPPDSTSSSHEFHLLGEALSPTSSTTAISPTISETVNWEDLKFDVKSEETEED